MFWPHRQRVWEAPASVRALCDPADATLLQTTLGSGLHSARAGRVFSGAFSGFAVSQGRLAVRPGPAPEPQSPPGGERAVKMKSKKLKNTENGGTTWRRLGRKRF